ncbi:MAG TPA: 6-pyruvoyl-tetrahydropterin synthase-related protein [Pyrinomonadaceae bacterium]|nr:6-pyruvoyl-tetrahydropterin synthase-related protein [Pyrinomonadaceae bacterium]
MLQKISNLNNRSRLALDLSIILLSSIVVVIPILIYGIPHGNDLRQHLQFAQTFYDSLMNGVFYPSWAYLPNFGYGDVGVRFYPPLTSYLLSAFRWLTGNWFDAYFLTTLFLFFQGAVGAYFWAREGFSRNASLVGGITYIFIPYHFNQIYQASFIAEFSAAAILPFCFLFINRVCLKGKWIDSLGLAISVGILFISHLPTTVMSAFLFSIYTLFLLRKANFIQTIFKLSTAILISLLLSSFYWVRMVTELNFVKHASEAYSSDYFSFKSNFVFANMRRLLSPDPSLELIVFITIGILISHMVIYSRGVKKENNYPIVNVLVVGIIALLMSTIVSTPIWEALPILQKIQFPTRWLIFLSLGTAFFVAATFDNLVENFKSTKRFLSILAIGLLFMCLPYNFFRTMENPMSYPKDFFNGMVERIKTGESNECWWTVWSPNSISENGDWRLPRPELTQEKVTLNNRNVSITEWSPTERTFTINEGEAGQAKIAIMYYPHWKATVNGQSVEVAPNETGMISFPIPSEMSNVRLSFQEPQKVIASFYVSGLSWIIVLGFLFFYLLLGNKNRLGIRELNNYEQLNSL